MSAIYCGFAKDPQHHHPLENGVFVDQKFVSFILKSHKNFDPAKKVCSRCNNAMQKMYFSKKEKARQLRTSRNELVSSVSSLSQTKSSSSISSLAHSNEGTLSQSVSMMDSFDRLVTKTPMHRKQDKTKSVNGDISTESDANVLIAIENMGGSPILSSQSSNEHSVGNKNKQSSGGILIQDRRTVIATATPRNVLALTRHNDVVPSPTIYDNEEGDAHYIVQDISVRLPQVPATSAAEQATFTGDVNKPSKMRLINDFFGSVPKSDSRAANTTSSNLSPKTSTVSTTNIMTGILRTTNGRPRNIVAEDTTPNEQQQSDNGDDGSLEDSDDDQPAMSLNFYDDSVRLPQYQPVPKRRPFIHTDPKVMDIYIQGLHGG